MGKVFHSLRFQLPAVVTAVFLGILLLLVLFFREIKGVQIKTRQLSQLGELQDCVGNWFFDLGAAAQERKELRGPNFEAHRKGLRETMEHMERRYAEVSGNLESGVESTRMMRALHAQYIGYANRLDGFMKSEPASAGTSQWAAADRAIQATENDLRNGLRKIRETVITERKEKLQGLDASLRKAKDRFVYSLLLLLAAVGYVAVVLKWKVVEPLKVLEHGATEIGHGALGHQVKVSARNEIGELAHVFNWMSVQLDQKQKSELRLKRLEAIEQIVRSVNHEINNPLMVISGSAEYLLAVLESPDPGVETKLNAIMDEVQRIFTVTQRLKDIKEPITANYLDENDPMIDIVRSSEPAPAQT